MPTPPSSRFQTHARRRRIDNVNVTQHSSLGALWFIGWLFTIGYLKLSFWKGALGLVVWPYFLGSHFAG